MTTVQQIIEAAFSRASENDPGKLANDSELIPLVDRVFQALYAIAAAAAPDRFVSRSSVTLAGSPPSAALATDVIDVRRVQRVSGARVTVFPLEEMDKSWHLAPAVYRQGSSLVSRAKTGDPVAGDALTVWQLDAPATLTALSSILDARFPTRHVELIIDWIALYLATKDSGRDQAEIAAAAASRNANMETFLRLSGLSMTALQSPHGGAIIQRINSLLAIPGSGAGGSGAS